MSTNNLLSLSLSLLPTVNSVPTPPMTTPFLSFPYEQRASTHFHRSVGRPVVSSPPGQPAFGLPESEEGGRYVLSDALLLLFLLLLFCGLVGVVALVGVLAVAFHLHDLWGSRLAGLGLVLGSCFQGMTSRPILRPSQVSDLLSLWVSSGSRPFSSSAVPNPQQPSLPARSSFVGVSCDLLRSSDRSYSSSAA